MACKVMQMNKSIVVAVGVVGLIGAGIVLFLSDGQSTEKLLSDPSTLSAEYPWLPGNQPDLAADDHAPFPTALTGMRRGRSWCAFCRSRPMPPMQMILRL